MSVERRYNRIRLARIIGYSLVIVAANGVTSSLAATDALPDPVAHRLTSNVAALSPITVHWTMRRTSQLPPAEMFRQLKIDNNQFGRAFFSPLQAVFRLDGRKLFIRFDYEAPTVEGTGSATYTPLDTTQLKEARPEIAKAEQPPLPVRIVGYHPEATEKSFDGSRLYIGRPVASRPTLFIEQVDSAPNPAPANAGDLWLFDYWHQVGYRMPKWPSEFAVSDPVHSEILALASQPNARVEVSRESIDGSEYLKIHIDAGRTRSAFYTDEQLGYAVRERRDFTPDGHVIRVAKLENFERLDTTPALWLPRRCTVDQHVWRLTNSPSPPASTAIFTETYEVTKIDKTPLPESAFLISYNHTPGAIVTDRTIEGGITYTVPAQPDDLEAVIEQAKSATAPSRRPLIRWILLLLNAIIVLAILTAIVWKKWGTWHGSQVN